MAVIIML